MKHTKKFLSVLLAGSLLVSLLAGAAGAASNATVNKTSQFNTYAALSTTSGTADTLAKNNPKLLIFTGTSDQDGIRLIADLNGMSPSKSASVIILFSDVVPSSSDQESVLQSHKVADAQYVMYSADVTQLQADYASKIGLAVKSPMAVLVNSNNIVSLITTGYSQEIVDTISTELGLSADSTTNCTSTDGTLSPDEQTLLRLINKTRGTRPLTTCTKMQTAAHIRALEIAKKYDTIRPDTTSDAVFKDVGLSYSTNAENIYRGNTPDIVMQYFQSTDLTRTNMSNTAYLHAGIGRQYSSASGYNWAVPFMSDTNCSITEIHAIDMPQIETTITDANGIETTTSVAKTFPTGTSIDEMGGVVHLTCGAHAEDWVCPLTSELCPAYDSTKAGTQTVTVNAYGQTRTFDVTLTKASETVKMISINKNATTRSFKEGDELDTTGLELTVKYSDGSSQVITQGFSCSPTQLNIPGTQTVTVSYTDPINNNVFTATYSIEVAASTKVTKIEIQQKPTKLLYAMNESLDPTGLILKETLSDGKTTSTQTVTSGYTCSPTRLTTTGTAVPITVTCGGQTTTFDVTVVQSLTVNKIDIRSYPTKMSYIAGESFNPSGLTLNAYYTDAVTVKPVSSGYTCSPTSFDTAGKQTVTVTYEGINTTFEVSVAARAVSSLKVATKPTTLKYYVGDTLDTTGLTLTATYNDKSTETISTSTTPASFVCTPTKLDKVGTQTITAEFGGQKTSFSVTVTEPAVTAVAITTKPTTVGYIKGNTLSTTGMVLTATLANGKTQSVTDGFTCTPTKLSTVGTQTVTVTYKGKTATYSVSVVDVSVSTLTLTTKPTKLSYYQNETLVTTGMVLTAAMTDGTTKKVTSGFTCSPTTLTTTGTRTITVTYGNKSVSYTVSVAVPVIASIAVKTQPTLLKYNQGDVLQTTGLVLTATTENKAKIDDITTGYTCTPTYLKAGGTQTITVTYSGKTTTFTVSVKEKTANAAFVDIVKGQWFYNYVNDLTTRGLLSGTNNNDGTYSFRPYSSITRAEFVTMLGRASGLNLSNYYYSSFSDVSTSNWACNYVTWAYVNGIVTGANGKFRPSDNVTRQEMATILNRFTNYITKSMDMNVTPVTFKDDDAIASWAKNSVIMMQKAGIINGSKNSDKSYSFRPLDNATRAEAAKVVSVFLDK